MHNYDYISMGDAKSIMQLDAISDRKNIDQVYIAVNLHCYLAEDLGSPIAAKILRLRYLRTGLVSTVSSCSDLFYKTLDVDFSTFPDCDDDLYDVCSIIHEKAGISGVSQFLRFLKRFTYRCPDREDTYEKFITVNSSCFSFSDYRTLGERGNDFTLLDKKGGYVPGPTIMSMLRDEINDILGYSNPAIRGTLYDTDPYYGLWDNLYGRVCGSFSSGSTADGTHSVAERIWVLTQCDNRYQQWPNQSGHPALIDPCSYDRDTEKWWNVFERNLEPTCIQVPKSLTSRRLIAPEPVYRAFRSSKTLWVLRFCLEASGYAQYINEHDQDVNKERARSGSVGGTIDTPVPIATADLSSASDSISRDLLFQVFPEPVRPYFYDGICDYVVVNGHRRRVRCFSTSGNKLTWLVEAIYFLGLARVAVRLAAIGLPASEVEALLKYVTAYGDDIEVPTMAFDTLCELLSVFGHTVNSDKSYAVGLFRESCGGDYYAGSDITPSYWPRRILLKEDATFVPSLCNLQRQLYRFPSCRMFLTEYAVRLKPDITFSPVGYDCDDLWSGHGTVIGKHCKTRVKHRLPAGLKTSRVGAPKPMPVPVRVRGQILWPAFYQEWQYYQFLRHGRRYLTDEDEAWGISSPYLSLADWDNETLVTYK